MGATQIHLLRRWIFNLLIDYREKNVFNNVRVDYFAASLPDLLIWDDNLNIRNQIHCYYLMGLGHLGNGNISETKKYLQKARELDINHFGVNIHVTMAEEINVV